MIVSELDDLLQSLRFHCEAKGLSENTIRQYLLSLRRFYQWLPEGVGLAKVSPRDIERHMAEFSKGRRPATVRHHFAGIQQVFRWHAGREGYASPVLGLDPPKLPESPKDTVTVEQFTRVLAGIERRKVRDAALISLLFDAGLRVSEAIALDWRDINWKERTITVADTKNGDIRLVPFSPVTGVKLDLLRSRTRLKDVPWVFGSNKGGRLKRIGAYELVKRTFAQAGIPNISPHDLRHSFATAWLEANPQGTDTLMAIGGWKSESMMRHYTRRNRQARAIEDYRKNAPLARR